MNNRESMVCNNSFDSNRLLLVSRSQNNSKYSATVLEDGRKKYRVGGKAADRPSSNTMALYLEMFRALLTSRSRFDLKDLLHT